MSIWPTGTNQYLLNQVALSNSIRRIWVNNNQWIRALVYSILFQLGDQDAIQARLEQNADDLAALFAQFYGQSVGGRIRQNYLIYIRALTALIEAYRTNDASAIADQRQTLYEVADQFAQILSEINRYWDRATLQAVIYGLVNFTETQILRILAGDYAQSIQEYDEFMDQAYHFSDDLTFGILKQFQV